MAALNQNLSFDSPPETYAFAGFLFDFDGTVMDSTDAIVKNWHDLGKLLGVDGDVILQTSHGRRSIEVLHELNPEYANWDYINEMEGQIPFKYGADAKELPGSRNLISALSSANVPWAVVTSGTRPLITGWLQILKLAEPTNLVAAEDVTVGKPNPEGYALGWSKLGLNAALAEDRKNGVVLEDAPAGIRAGKAAGFKVIALATTHAVKELKAAKPDWIVRDLDSVRFKSWDQEKGLAEVEISNVLRD